MKTLTQNGQTYRLPGTLSAFQQSLYIHLIDWKWAHITREPGCARGNLYDAILPDNLAGQYPLNWLSEKPLSHSIGTLFVFESHNCCSRKVAGPTSYSASGAKNTQKDKHDCRPDQETKIVLAAVVVHFVHL